MPAKPSASRVFHASSRTRTRCSISRRPSVPNRTPRKVRRAQVSLAPNDEKTPESPHGYYVQGHRARSVGMWSPIWSSPEYHAASSEITRRPHRRSLASFTLHPSATIVTPLQGVVATAGGHGRTAAAPWWVVADGGGSRLQSCLLPSCGCRRIQNATTLLALRLRRSVTRSRSRVSG